MRKTFVVGKLRGTSTHILFVEDDGPPADLLRMTRLPRLPVRTEAGGAPQGRPDGRPEGRIVPPDLPDPKTVH